MKRFGLAILAVTALVVVAARPASTQTRSSTQTGTTLGIGLGLTMPMGDWGDANAVNDKMGFHFGVGAGLALGTAPVRLRVEGSWTQTSHQTGVDGNTRLLGGMVNLVYPIQTAGQIRPYILGGVGFYSTKLSSGGSDTSKTSVGFGGGVGIRVPMSSLDLFVEARYLTLKAFDLTFAQLPITAGLSFPIGGKRM
jgi:opacity protein-like surface antigen